MIITMCDIHGPHTGNRCFECAYQNEVLHNEHRAEKDFIKICTLLEILADIATMGYDCGGCKEIREYAKEKAIEYGYKPENAKGA